MPECAEETALIREICLAALEGPLETVTVESCDTLNTIYASLMRTHRSRKSRYILILTTVLLALWIIFSPILRSFITEPPQKKLSNLASPLFGAHIDPDLTTPAYFPGAQVVMPLMSRIGLSGLIDDDLQVLMSPPGIGLCLLVREGPATIALQLGTSGTISRAEVNAVSQDKPFTVSYVIDGIAYRTAHGRTGSDAAVFDPPVETLGSSGLIIFTFNNKEMQCYHQVEVYGMPTGPPLNPSDSKESASARHQKYWPPA